MKKFKVVIAEDDEILLEGLMKKINWDAFNATVVGGVNNGSDALDLIAKTNPDILLTDIKMPKMDGIELMKNVREKHPGISVVVISAYDEFKFAQSAVKQGATDYILKPIDIDSLEQAVKRIIENQFAKNAINEKLEKIEKFEKEKHRGIIDKMYEDAMLDKYGNGDFEAIYENYLEKTKKKAFLVAVLKNHFDSSLYKKMQHFLQTNFSPSIRTFRLFGRLFLLFIAEKDEDMVFSLEIKAAIKEEFERQFFDLGIAFANGDVVFDVHKINQSMKKAMLVDEISYNIDNQWDFYISSFGGEEESSKIVANSLTKKIYESITKGSVDLTQDYYSKYENNLKFCKENANSVFIYTINFIFDMISKDCESLGMSLPTIIGSKDPVKDILQMKTLQQRLKVFYEFVLQISEDFNQNLNGTNAQLIKNARDYIEENFKNSALRINEVAQFVGLSKNYFSTLFATVCGKTFTDYLTEKRIGESQKLILTSQYKNYEIAYMVGFENPTYFSFAFKKFVGVSPTDYAKMINE